MSSSDPVLPTTTSPDGPSTTGPTSITTKAPPTTTTTSSTSTSSTDHTTTRTSTSDEDTTTSTHLSTSTPEDVPTHRPTSETPPPDPTSEETTSFTTTSLSLKSLGTLTSNNDSGSNGFFANKGAVAAVFVFVGLAITFIFVWIFFVLRRRKRQLHDDLETYAAAAEAASSYRDPPLAEDDHPNQRPDMRERTTSALGGTTVATTSIEGGGSGDFNPYSSYAFPIRSDGYGLARAATFPSGTPIPSTSHSATPSGSSNTNEPLLFAFNKDDSPGPRIETPPSPGSSVPPVPPRNPKRLTHISASAVPPQINIPILDADDFLDGPTTDHRLEPNTPGFSQSDEEPRDDYDYSRKLEIRNLPDNASIASHNKDS
ncbi:hypothetical protein DL96DRAFT_1573362 [Flagelloscypha sp. PMI_526]|nr:hypothetical protein DL96DRAFT_1573362 [Flagelloscypha sp. PMI_526]